MLKKFPFKDSILKDLGIINPEQVCPYTFNTVENLAKRFPQLDLHTSNSLDRLREEFTDFKLSPGDHPSLEKPDYKSAVGWKPRAGAFWIEVGKIKNPCWPVEVSLSLQTNDWPTFHTIFKCRCRTWLSYIKENSH